MGLVCGCQLITAAPDPDAMRRSVENLAYSEVVSYFSEAPGTRHGQPVDKLVYTADEEKALFQMFAIAEEAAKRWDANVSVTHRLGELIPGDVALAVVAAASTRSAAFDCCKFVSDGVAERAPIWA